MQQKCSNCNATLPIAPHGTVMACPFCGSQNRIIDPTAAPPPGAPGMPGAFPGAPPPQFQVDPRVAVQMQQQVHHAVQAHARASKAGAVIGLVTTVLVIGGVVAANFLITKEVDDTTNRAMAEAEKARKEAMERVGAATGGGSSTAGTPGEAKLKLAELGKLELGGGWKAVDAPGMVGTFTEFDPIANFEWFMGIARAWSPDAVLTRIDVSKVKPDGKLDCSAASEADAGYRFESPARIASAKQLQQVSEEKVASELMVQVQKGEVKILLNEYRAVGIEEDEHPTEIRPTCTLAQIMEKMRAAGVPLRPGYDMYLYWREYKKGWIWSVSVSDYRGDIPEVNATECVAGGAPAGTAAAAAPALDRTAYQTLDGCTCRANIDGQRGEETMQLAMKVDSQGTTVTPSGTLHEFEFSYVMDIGGAEPLALAVNDRTSPPKMVVTSVFAIGMACSEDIVAVVSQNFVTGWSVTRRAMIWSTQLEGTYPRGAGEEGQLAVNCNRLTVNRGIIRIPLEGGTVKVKVADGSIVR